MRTVLAILILLSTNCSFGSVNLICKPDNSDGNEDGHLLIYGELNADCKDSKENDYSITLKGIGPGLNGGGGYFDIFCPTVSKKRLNRQGHIGLGAIDATAIALYGVNAGLAINYRGGTCFIGGFEGGFGASVKVGYMKIMKGTLLSNGIDLNEQGGILNTNH